ncbi:MAG: hypothetical protein EBU52_11840 [Cytophagia bacterium]|nr:hypothetical protein [Cytophagia bacterium]
MATKKKPQKKPIKKAKKKKVISKTEKKLRNQRRYQTEKKNKIRKQLNESILNLDSFEKEKIGKNIVYTIPDKIKKQLGIKRKTYKATKQTLINAYYQKIYKINNIIDEKEQKLINRFKFKQTGGIAAAPRKKGEIQFPVGFVWNIDKNIPLVVFKNESIKKVNGKDKKKDSLNVLNEIESEKQRMNSKHFMFLIGKEESGEFRIYVQNLEKNKKKLKNLRNTFAK